MNSTLLVGGRVIDGASASTLDAEVLFDGDAIIEVGERIARPDHVDVIDVRGALVAPGLIDLHGDAFERSLMPRGGVFASMELALADNACQLAASGITTSFLSATDSWEPGLRSRETLRGLIDALSSPTVGPEVLVHARHETTNTDGFDELAGWVEDGSVSMISFADHTPGAISRPDATPTRLQVDRSGCTSDEFAALTQAAVGRREAGAVHDRQLAELARRVGCPTASHDGRSLADIDRDIALSVTIAEFPMSVELAASYRDAGMRVLLGAPNLVRGGSHLGNLSVAEALDPAAGDALCSDYHYPSLLHAPFAAVRAGLCTLPLAWQTVSSSPAAAAGLGDRGVLEPGRRADVVVVDARAAVPRVQLMYVDGQRAYEVAWTPTN